MKQNEPDSVKSLIRRTFDSHVNRPLVGNAPVRKIMFRSADDSIALFAAITKELDWALCNVMLKGNSLGRIRRMLGHVSISSVNILSRSLLVLNLYFDDLLFGQYPLAELVAAHMFQLSYIPHKVFTNKCSQAFLNRLAKPIYDTLKVLVLNRNRQRAYIEVVMLHDWVALRQEAHIVDVTWKREVPNSQEMPPHFSLYVLYTTVDLMDHLVTLGIELNLFCSIHELSVAYWYRDFLLSSLFSQVSTMRRGKLLAKQLESQQAEQQSKSQKGKKKGGKHKKNGAHNQAKPPTPQDIEDEYDFLLLNLKRNLCRGSVRVGQKTLIVCPSRVSPSLSLTFCRLLQFLAALHQAGLVERKDFEFTPLRRIFEKRFEAFAAIPQPPPLSYDDYLQGSDFSKVSQNELLASTSECFSASKSMVDKLLAQQSTIDKDYLSMQEAELRRLAKVCIGNSVYVQKLKQKVDENTGKADATVDIDVDTHNQFCTVKIS